MGTETRLAELTCFAIHQIKDGWEITAPSDDPCVPAYWRIAVIREHGWSVGKDECSPRMAYPWCVS